jgi:hypothetical protein
MFMRDSCGGMKGGLKRQKAALFEGAAFSKTLLI